MDKKIFNFIFNVISVQFFFETKVFLSTERHFLKILLKKKISKISNGFPSTIFFNFSDKIIFPIDTKGQRPTS
jgi:hypothetical protein